MENSPRTINLENYVMPKSLMLKVVAMRYMRRSLSIFFLILIVLVALGVIFNWKWLILALMMVFIAGPIILMWLYVRHCISLEIAMNTSEHYLTISEDGIKCRWRPLLHITSEKEKENDSDSGDESLWKEMTIPLNRIEDISFSMDAMTVWLKNHGREKGFFYIPYVTIPEKKADDLVRILRNNHK